MSSTASQQAEPVVVVVKKDCGSIVQSLTDRDVGPL